MKESEKLLALIDDINEIATNSPLREEWKKVASENLRIPAENMGRFINDVSDTVQLIVFWSARLTSRDDISIKESIHNFLLRKIYPEDLNSIIANREDLTVCSLGKNTKKKYEYIL
jgi:hypothetical protein